MIKWILMMMLGLNTAAYADKPVGFLWYNIERAPKKIQQTAPKGVPFNALSYTERDAVLHFYTMEALHKARHTKKVEDMRAFLKLQDYWLKESSQFKSLFQKTMLAYPQYDYAVTHPTSNVGAKTTDEVRESHKNEIINQLSQTHGLLFFYRGKSPYDLKQIPIIADFCRRFHLALMPISVDGVVSSEFVNSKVDTGQANRLSVRYFPALLLVNPQTQHVEPLAYGLATQDVLMERLVQVATHFKGDE
ncbi:TPA: type-F conjugative transfer system pilin assembly protein TraF [Legionella pneumophila]|nr:type-F conjugative transfer system pilin assembly protein TraF [Legionella pneumophila]HCU5995179.1 type-F conjugative transfer system pilin assembly protein TraF [Legionella pneumophila]